MLIPHPLSPLDCDQPDAKPPGSPRSWSHAGCSGELPVSTPPRILITSPKSNSPTGLCLCKDYMDSCAPVVVFYHWRSAGHLACGRCPKTSWSWSKYVENVTHLSDMPGVPSPNCLPPALLCGSSGVALSPSSLLPSLQSQGMPWPPHPGLINLVMLRFHWSPRDYIAWSEFFFTAQHRDWRHKPDNFYWGNW